MGDASLTKPPELNYERHPDRIEFSWSDLGSGLATLTSGQIGGALVATSVVALVSGFGAVAIALGVGAGSVAVDHAATRVVTMSLVVTRDEVLVKRLGRRPQRMDIPKQLHVSTRQAPRDGLYATSSARPHPTQRSSSLEGFRRNVFQRQLTEREALFMEQEIENFLGIVDVPQKAGPAHQPPTRPSVDDSDPAAAFLIDKNSLPVIGDDPGAPVDRLPPHPE